MRSFILFGSYTEQRLYADRSTALKRHRFLTTFTMDRSVVHRVSQWGANTWTLFYFKGDDGWGYVDEDFNYTPWDEYIPDEKKVAHV